MKRIINGVVLLLAFGSVAYLSGCGPIDANDPSYMAQGKEANQEGKKDNYEDIYQAGDEPAAPDTGDEPKADEPKADEPKADEAQADVQKAAPVGQTMQLPVEQVVQALPSMRLATRHVFSPGVVERLPTIVSHSAEDRNFEREIQHHRVIHRPQLSLNKHLIRNNLNLNHTYWTKIINHPMSANQVLQTSSVSETQTVMPAVEVTAAPIASYGYGYARGFYGSGYGRGWGHGGFRRFY